jgi:hypothetical protein
MRWIDIHESQRVIVLEEPKTWDLSGDDLTEHAILIPLHCLLLGSYVEHGSWVDVLGPPLAIRRTGTGSDDTPSVRRVEGRGEKNPTLW